MPIQLAKNKSNTSDWWGELPKGWRVMKLKHLSNLEISNIDKHTIEGQQIVYLCNYVDVYKNEKITSQIPFMRASATDEQIKRLSLQKWDVLLTKDSETPDDIGIPAIVADELSEVVCGYHLAIARPNMNIIYGKFLFRVIQSEPIKRYYFSRAVGMTRYGLDKHALLETPIALPKQIHQQRAIADYLDRETAKIDALTSAKERLLEVLDEKRRAVITLAVTRGLNLDVPMRDSGIEWLGEIPAHWEVVRLKSVTHSLQTGPFGSQLHAEDYVDNGIPLINPAHLKDGRIFPDPKVTVDDETAERLAIHKLEVGDIVFARRGEIGRCGLVTEDEVGWLCGSGSLRARPIQSILDSSYLVSLLLNTFVGTTLSIMAVGTTMDNLNTEIVGALILPLPPVNEQHQIMIHLKPAIDKINSLILSARKTINLLHERRTALISAAVSGKLHILR